VIGVGEARVCRDETAAEHLGERDVGGVVCREVLAQLPDPAKQADDRESPHPEPRPSIQRRDRAAVRPPRMHNGRPGRHGTVLFA
jgi:hypothetical protein